MESRITSGLKNKSIQKFEFIISKRQSTQNEHSNLGCWFFSGSACFRFILLTKIAVSIDLKRNVHYFTMLFLLHLTFKFALATGTMFNRAVIRLNTWGEQKGRKQKDGGNKQNWNERLLSAHFAAKTKWAKA